MIMPLFKIATGVSACALLLSPVVSLGHSKESHQASVEERVKVPSSENQNIEASVHEIHLEINREYLATVKPILAKSCANCHSSETSFPWYYNVPGIKQLIDSDISEAKRHLDLSKDFPFAGHGSPDDDLEAIRESVSKRKMPPWSYRLMHPESELTPEAEEEILNWVKESLFLLGTVSEGKLSDDKN